MPTLPAHQPGRRIRGQIAGFRPVPEQARDDSERTRLRRRRQASRVSAVHVARGMMQRAPVRKQIVTCEIRQWPQVMCDAPRREAPDFGHIGSRRMRRPTAAIAQEQDDRLAIVADAERIGHASRIGIASRARDPLQDSPREPSNE